jgi:hypothetical protein
MPEPDHKDQELVELLNELRVVLPGVQVLFAFLLTVPFSQRFTQLTSRDKAVYFAALLFAAAASAMLIAPSVHARLTWHHHDKGWLLRVSNPLMIAGSCFLLGGIACAIYLVADLLYQSSAAAIATAIVVLVLLTTWYGIPLVHRRASRRERAVP